MSRPTVHTHIHTLVFRLYSNENNRYDKKNHQKNHWFDDDVMCVSGFYVDDCCFYCIWGELSKYFFFLGEKCKYQCMSINIKILISEENYMWQKKNIT